MINVYKKVFWKKIFIIQNVTFKDENFKSYKPISKPIFILKAVLKSILKFFWYN